MFAHLHLLGAAALFTACVVQIDGAIFLPAIFSDGMVLQDHATYDQRPFIYGYADLDEVVTVVRTQPDGQNATYLGTADNVTGFWIVQPDPDYFAASQNNLTFSIWGSNAPDNVTFIRDVAYGDVFLCSGQSNMNENVAAVFSANETMSGSYPFMRLFSVAEAGALEPQRDVPAFVSQGSTPCTFPQFPIANSSQRCNTWQTATEATIIGSFSATCFYTALSLSQQLTGGRVLGLIHASVSGTPMRQWVAPPALAACDGLDAAPAPASSSAAVPAPPPPLLGTFPPGNSTLWNAMIAPLSRYAIRGVIWDQGESDAGEAPAYFSCLFQSLIASWRSAWRIGDFAFVYAQLGAQDSGSWPTYWVFPPRLAQASALPGRAGSTTDTTGMAAAYDIGDMGSPYPPAHVHSRRKPELGRRLALALQHTQYALQWPASPGLINLSATVDWSGPVLRAATATGAADGAALLSFLVADGQGLFINDTADCWQCCQLAADTIQFGASVDASSWVNATIAVQGDALSILATPTVSGAYGAVRYAANLWTQCAIYAKGNGVPSEPFLVPIVASAAAGDAAHAPPPRRRSVAHAARAAAPTRPEGNTRTWTTWKGRVMPSVGEGIIAPVPPMGYNTWNSYHTSLSENIMLGIADSLIATGLAALGFTSVNMDDGWMVDRWPNGTIITDPVRFPNGVRAVADAVHARGLHFGLYTAQRQYTCQMRPGSYLFEDIDIQTYCDWGIDYVKTDACDGEGNALDNQTWIDFRAGIDACVAGGGRPMVLSVESCGDPSPGGCASWIGKLANSWRTTGDIQATFTSVLSNLDGNNEMAAFTKPGNWADADMLQVGNAGLSHIEEKSHFGAWCLIASPLLIGCDLEAINPVSLSILSAPEVIAINQDVLGVQGIRVSASAPLGTECWAKPLFDGSVAALLLNRGLGAADATCTWEELGLKATDSASVRDLWERAVIGTFNTSFTASNLPGHGSMLVKLTPL